MELAAKGAADGIAKRMAHRSRGLFICGKGNNAGDALASARWLIQVCDHQCHIHLLLGEEDLSQDTSTNLHLLRELKTAGASVQISSGNDLSALTSERYDYLVDGLLGTGSAGKLRSPLPEAIQLINSLQLPLFAMDLPTGLDPDSGIAQSDTVKASVTFTFGTNKTGFYLNKASHYTGEIECIPLPFPKHLFPEEKARLLLPGDETPQSLIRKDGNHKYDRGVVHILAGSSGLTGAAIMASLSAWRQGAGAVFLYSPAKLAPIYESTLPQIIKVVTGSVDDDFLMESHFDLIAKTIQKRPGTLLAGPGLGQNPSTRRLLERLFSEFSLPLVLDADGLSVFNALESKFKQQKRDVILTPHPGETSTWLGSTYTNDHERLLWAETFSEESGVTLISKGNPTMVTTPGATPLITGYDTAPFTRAGFGDVLAGAVAALLSISGDPLLSASEALLSGHHSYLHHTLPTPFSPEHLL